MARTQLKKIWKINNILIRILLHVARLVVDGGALIHVHYADDEDGVGGDGGPASPRGVGYVDRGRVALDILEVHLLGLEDVASSRLLGLQ